MQDLGHLRDRTAAGLLSSLQKEASVPGWTRAPVSYRSWSGVSLCYDRVQFQKQHSRRILNELWDAPLLRLCSAYRPSVDVCHSIEAGTTNFNARGHREPSPELNTAICTMLRVVNLAEPGWMTDDCDQAQLSQVLCLIETSAGNTNQMADSYEVSGHQGCRKDDMLHNRTCYKFVWFRDRNEEIKVCTHSKRLQLVEKDESVHGIFHHLFTATSATNQTFVHFNETGGHNFHHYQKVWTEQRVYRSTEREGILPCFSEMQNLTVSSSILVQCENDSFMSSTVANGVICRNSVHRMIFAQNKNESCAPHFYKNIQGKCALYTRTLKKPDTNNSTVCSDSHVHIAENWTSDCGNKKPENMNLILHKRFNKCTNQNQLPCLFGQAKCYNISDICVYRLDKSNQILPCAAGSHMQECNHFECHSHFKCPSFYCVPWGYICNGKWDCPNGLDEIFQFCHKRTCRHLFKCKLSAICLHIHDICNSYKECPFEDDEVLCSLIDQKCLQDCRCLNYAIMCNSSNMRNSLFRPLPYIVFHITNCALTAMDEIIFSEQIVLLNLSRNSISSVSFHKLYSAFIFTLDLSYITLSKLHQLDFHQMDKLRFILLVNNEISAVERGSFHSIPTIHLLDMSHNKLRCFSHHMFFNVSLIHVLILLNNPLTAFDQVSISLSPGKIGIIHSDSDALCCLVHKKSKCTVRRQWSARCSYLLSWTNEIVFLGVTCCALFWGLASQICNFLTIKVTGKWTSYSAAVCCIQLGYFALPVYVAILFAAHTYFKGTYIQNDSFW